MNKKTIVIALLALQLGSQVYAHSSRNGVSKNAVDAVLQSIRPSAKTWRLVTKSGVGPNVLVSDVAKGKITHPEDFSDTAIGWSDVLAATDFMSLVPFDSTTSMNAFFAIPLTTTATSAVTGPTITFTSSVASSRALCGLYDSNSRLIYRTGVATFGDQLAYPGPIVTGSPASSYSSNRIFPTTTRPGVGNTYYMLCGVYTIGTDNEAVPIQANATGFIISW